MRKPLLRILSFLVPGLPLVLVGCLNPSVPAQAGPGNAFSGRSDQLIEQIADNYKPVDYHDRGKYTFPLIIARLTRYGETDQRSRELLEEYASGKYDFFHFPFVGLARILGAFPDAPSVAVNRKSFLEQILIHDGESQFNALTGEGTENHVSMSRTSGYIFAQEAMRYPSLRPTAEKWEGLLREWILGWSRRIYHHGTGEWDSGPYTAYNLIGWLNLHDFAESAEVRRAARAVLDYYAANIALKMTDGLLGGPESRGATRYGPISQTATEYLAWIWFGPTRIAAREGFFKPNEYIQAVHAATSSYRPPRALMDLARKRIPTPALYHNTKPDYLLTRKAESHETFLIEDGFTLGTAQTPYGGWINTAYGIINWKLVARAHGSQPPAVLSGNGGMKSMNHPRGRNPFDQFLQYRSTVIQMTRVPADAEAIENEVGHVFEEWRADSHKDFLERWGRTHHFHGTYISDSGRGDIANAKFSILHLPAEARPLVEGNWAFLQINQAYVGVRSLSGSPPVHNGDRLLDEAPRNALSGFVVEVANARDYPGFDAFRDALKGTRLERDPESILKFHYTTLEDRDIAFQYSDTGQWREMIYDWGSGVRERRIGFNTTDWTQPAWPEGRHQGRIPRLWVAGKLRQRSPDGPILNGPFLSLSGSVLRIEDTNGRRHEVDYRGDEPTFQTTTGPLSD